MKKKYYCDNCQYEVVEREDINYKKNTKPIICSDCKFIAELFGTYPVWGSVC